MKLQRRKLSIGMKGDDVKLLQKELSQLGFSIKADGIYGKFTKKAVMQFQEQVGVVITGLVDEKITDLIKQERKKLTGRIIFRKKEDLNRKISDHLNRQSPYKERLNAILNRHLMDTLFGSIIYQPDSNLRKKIESLGTIDLFKYKSRNVKTFADEVIKPTFEGDKELLAEYNIFEKSLPRNKSIGAYLYLDKPIDDHPAFTGIVKNTKTFLLLKESIINNNEGKLQQVLMALTNPDETADPQFNYILEKKIVTKNELNDIKFTLDLGTISLNNTDFIASLKNSGIKTLKELISFDVKGWANWNNANGISTPVSFKGKNKEINYARHLEEVVTSIYPTEAFIDRLSSLDEEILTITLNKVEKFLKNNPKVKVEEDLPRKGINWGNTDRNNRRMIRENIQFLRNVSRKYDYLDVPTILNSRVKSIATKIKNIKKNISQISKFLSNNPGFDLQTADFHPNRGLIKKPEDKKAAKGLKINWAGFSEANIQALILQLKKYQRLYRIYPRFGVADVLMSEGFNSARQILTITEKKFIEQHHGLFGKDRQFAKKIYKVAKERVNKVSLLWANSKDTAGSRVYNPNPGPGLFNNLGQDVIDYVKDVKGYQDIFGEVRFCDCPNCRSIFSPASYFVDLMRFINEGIPNHTLDERRPDLKSIKTSCENTNTLVPYIELVNEVVEEKLGRTSVSTDKPYDDLLSATYPFTLPFNLYLDQVRVFIEHFRSTLWEVYDLFVIDKLNDTNEKKHVSIESLRISPEELHVLITQRVGDVNALKECYGVDASDNLITKLRDIKTFLKHTNISRNELNELIGFDLKEEADKKDLFINQDGNNRYISIRRNDTDPLTEEFKAVSTNSEVNPPDINLKLIDRLHRFIRLSKKLDWSFKDLDWTLKSINATNIDEPAIIKIAQIEKIRKTFEVPLDVLTSFWSNIKSTGHTNTIKPEGWPLFDRVFKDPDSQSSAYDFTNLAEEWDYNDPDENIKLGLLAALEVYEIDLLLLFDKLKNELDPTAQDKTTLNINNLSLIYRFIKLSRNLEISIREFFLLWELLQKQNPISIDDVDDITDFVEWIKQSEWTIYQLHYVLTSTANEFIDPGFHEDDLRIFLIEQKTEQTQFDKYDTPEDIKIAKKKIASEKLSLFFGMTPQLFSGVADMASLDLSDVNLLDACIQPLSEEDAIPELLLAGARNFQRYKYLLGKFNLTEIELSSIKENPVNFGLPDPLNMDVNPLGIKHIKNLEHFKNLKNIYSDNLNQLIEYLNVNAVAGLTFDSNTNILYSIDTALNQLITIDTVTGAGTAIGALGFNNVMALAHDPNGDRLYGVDTTVNQLITIDTATGAGTAIGNLGFNKVTSLAYDSNTDTLYGIDSALNQFLTFDTSTGNASVVSDLGLIHLAGIAYDPNTDTLFGVDFTNNELITIDTLTGTITLVGDISGFIDIVAIAFNANTNKLYGIDSGFDQLIAIDAESGSTAAVGDALGFDLAQREMKAKQLSNVTRWNKDEIVALYSHFWPRKIGDTKPANPNYQGVPNVWRIKECIEFSKRLGVAVQSLITLFNDLLLPSTRNLNTYKGPSDGLFDIIKAKYEQAEWNDTYYPIKNYISELKRDALTAYLTGTDNSRDLYELLLVDTEMSSCFEISRIKFAISSLQLYFQRCQMNLEKDTDGNDIVISPELQKEWAWRKNYRVWEANRKVFLYPENYIYPELRDSKSPQFKELEDELRQGEITEVNVERAYTSYLDKFVQLANLTTAGTYYDDTTDILHFIGRSKTEPHLYYYRRYEENKVWTPWEKIDLTINAEYVTPVFAFRRLFIFWVETHTEKGVDETQNLAGSSFSPEITKATVKYSFFDLNKKWTQPQVLEKNVDMSANNFDIPKAYRIYVPEKVDDSGIHLLNPGIFYDENEENITLVFRILSPNLTKSIRKIYTIDMSWTNSIDILQFDSQGSTPFNTLFLGGLKNMSHEGANFTRHFWTLYTPSNLQRTDILGRTEYSSTSKIVFNDPSRFVINTKQSECLAKLTQNYGYLDSYLGVSIGVFGGSIHPLIAEETNVAAIESDYILPQYQYTSVSFERIDTQAVNNIGPVLFADGIKGMLHTENQYNLKESDFNELDPNVNRVDFPYPTTSVDFEGPYGLYYRELFFHAPFLIANRLNADQKFEEAQKWYHYIFNPTDPIPEDPGATDLDGQLLNNTNNRFWRYLPFRKSDLDSLDAIFTNNDAINAYRNDPFDPHAIARTRINAYQKTIVMKYIDNLLDWGDYKFAQDSIEAINEATNLYILAYDLLGKKPTKRGECTLNEPLTYRQIETQVQGGVIPEFFVDLENSYLVESNNETSSTSEGADVNMEAMNLYFCTPENEDFLRYWERVEDRLNKIRNCMNIKGIVRKLPQFQPEIDPMALVRAAASGRDISSVVSEITAGMVATPIYRFTYVIEKAKSLVANTQQLASALLGALEKKDAEELSQIHSIHENNTLKLTTKVKAKQLKEAEESIKALGINKQSANERNAYYKKLVKDGLITEEQAQLASMLLAWGIETVSNLGYMIAAIAHLVPNAGSPFSMNYGGREIGESSEDIAAGAKAWASFFNSAANMSSTMGGFARREEGWSHQEAQTKKEIENIEFQISAAIIRKEMIAQEITIHEKNIEQNDEINRFLKNKFTNKDLYQWMSNQLSGLYFQTYKMAYDLAKSVERAYQFETGIDESYINYGHWDSLKKGLLAGERLSLELNQLEVAYLDQNSRSFEIEKTVSLRNLDPKSLYDLITKGVCQFQLTEKLFDLDFPGHYFRKIKNVSITIPAIIGPYQNVKATLIQTSYQILKKPAIDGVKYLLDSTKGNNADVVEVMGATQQIAISQAVDDIGMFELNFRDERYLPFEGTGAISGWKLEMPKASNQFNFDSISDVIINLKYTALSDGGLRAGVVDLPEIQKIDGYRLASIKHEFSSEWHGFMNPKKDAEKHMMVFEINKNRFPKNINDITLTAIFVKLDLEESLYDENRDLKLGGTLSLGLKITATGTSSSLMFEFTDTKLDTIEETINLKLKDIESLEFSVIRKKSDDLTDPNKPEIPLDLRKRKDDGSVEVENIGGESHYFLDMEKLRNIGLVLTFNAKLIW